MWRAQFFFPFFKREGCLGGIGKEGLEDTLLCLLTILFESNCTAFVVVEHY